MRKVVVSVPGTSANCGPGFDCLGLALNIYNTFTFTEVDETTASHEGITCKYTGLGADILELEDPQHNLVVQSMKLAFNRAKRTLPKGELLCHTSIPPSRGLGSSATAIVGGLFLANELLHNFYTKDEMLVLANELEGHPDNVCPAIFGHLCCSQQDGAMVHHTVIPVDKRLSFVTLVPSLAVSTEKARGVLPALIDYTKAVANVGKVALFITAMEQGRFSLLEHAMEDYLHVPYRLPLIPNGKEAIEEALRHGALGATISGSGSSLIAYCDGKEEDIGQAMVNVFLNHQMEATYYVLKADEKGARVISSESL